ncbi:MAG: helicase-related protein, partial [Rhodospirillaceae bacterium]|nr:helicase-related protein [Rhodospirillaceae bacterium]
VADLASGRPTDRLVCGDVGFGKTEVALRAAFVAAMSGRQVALVVPTTLLARQHFNQFAERFKGFPIRVAQLSRMVTAKQAKETKAGLKEGTVDIVVGTHALLANDIEIPNLGLLIIDEEQHFGVKHKERLKSIKENVHVLTLSATPIPRTLQLALSGVRQMSLIATPPVDRLAVRTFITPFDPVVVREAIMRERFRGGQTFYVCPRISDQGYLLKTLKELVPEVQVAMVNGQMTPGDLEDVIGSFYDGKFDVLLATNIIESGLDLPQVNTIIIHRADMFGLAQLYQLRGRVGRSKTRAYAYLTLPDGKTLTPAAEKRLTVMQSLDSLGAGFQLASHDLDIRGAGNLLGEEQSGHIREVGIELYQQMLEEAVAEARGGGPLGEESYSPQVGIGISVMIPENYVSDLHLRMDLYRRIAGVADDKESEIFAAEMIDRFGTLPAEVENLLKVVSVKRNCLKANIEKIDAGPKGAVISFRNNSFPNPEGLVGFISDQVGTVKLKPDHTLVLKRAWDGPDERLKGVSRLVGDLAAIAATPAHQDN